jgi:nicotinamidase-related amidase
MMPDERHRIRILAGSLAVFALGLGLGLLVRADAPAKKDSPANLRSGDRKESPAPAGRIYQNRLKPLVHPQPLLADYPEFVQPVIEKTRYEAPALIDEPGADLDVRAWRFSYNARGIIELPNHLRADRTAAIMVHPWGIDDGQGWRTPEPAGVADFCTPDKNHLAGRHTRAVVDPLLKRLRGRVSLVLFSLRSHQYPAQAKIYRSIRHKPSEAERAQGRRELATVLNGFRYRGEPLPAELTLSDEHPVRDYFQQFPGLEAGARFNNAGFWDLPIPVTKDVEVFPDDVVYYDEEGYPALRDFLKQQGIRHVILTGYATDMCFCRTTAGYENLSKDFNVFLVGDATLATYPANETPRYATNAHISFASINQLITQCSWIRFRSDAQAKAER